MQKVSCLEGMPGLEMALGPGENLFYREDAVEHLYHVVTGRVSLLRHLADGRSVVLSSTEPARLSPKRRCTHPVTTSTVSLKWPRASLRCQRRPCLPTRAQRRFRQSLSGASSPSNTPASGIVGASQHKTCRRPHLALDGNANRSWLGGCSGNSESVGSPDRPIP